LENENDAALVKGYAQKTYAEIENSLKNTESATSQPAAEAVVMPLASGIEPEQIQASEQMKQAALSAPVRQENLFDEMVQRLEMMQTADQSKMMIQLKPSFLGSVTLQIAMDAQGLHVKISAADQAVRGMINGQINMLIESLENKNIAVAEVEVIYTGVDNGMSMMNSREGRYAQQPGQPKRTYAADKKADGAELYNTTFTSETHEYYLDIGVSTVEYRA
jgi:flagellar hook-length control protein FliK